MISISQHISNAELKKAIERHYSEIDNPQLWSHNAKDKLQLLYQTNLTVNQRDIVLYVIDNFKSLIIDPPKKLSKHINALEGKGFSQEIKGKSNAFKASLLKAFNYKDFRKDAASNQLAEDLDVKSCPYCNAQYTMTTKLPNTRGIKKLLFEFDHFFPKTKYPYLCLSFYNLIPCCSSCNRSKSSKPPTLENSFHPYCQKSVSEYFEFSIDNLDLVEFLY